MLLWVLVPLLLIVRENYPFSHFPMYSGMAPGAHYYYLADEQGEALPVKKLFGLSASRMKKVYYAKLNDIADEQGVDAYTLGKEEKLEAARELYTYFSELGAAREKWDQWKSWWEEKPQLLRFMRVDIRRVEGQIEKSTEQVWEGFVREGESNE